MAEHRIIRVYYSIAGTCFSTAHKADNIIRHILELLSGLLENPETANILEETDSTVDTAFIGEILTETLLTHNRFRSLDSKKRPGAAAQVGEIFRGGRNGCNCGCRVVTGYGNYRNRHQFLQQFLIIFL